MTSMTREMLYTLLTSRIDLALDRTSENPEYLTVCKQQGKAKSEIDKLFERFSDDEKQTIQRYDEGETHKETFEIRETYLQGLRDGFKILAFMGDLKSEVIQL